MLTIPSDPKVRLAAFRASVDEGLREALATPNGQEVFEGLDAQWPLLLERGAQRSYLAREALVPDLTRILPGGFPATTTPLVPKQLASVGGLVVQVAYAPELDLDAVSVEEPLPWHRYTFQLFDRGGLVPLGLEDAPDWLFEGGMPANYLPDTGTIYRGVFRSKLNPLFPLRFYRVPAALSALWDNEKSSYLAKLNRLGFESFDYPVTKPGAELMLSYSTYDEFEEKYDEWKGKAGKRPEDLLGIYRSAFRNRAPIGVVRSNRSGSIMYVAKAPPTVLAQRQQVREQQHAAAEAEAAQREVHAIEWASAVLKANTAPSATLRKIHDLRFTPDAKVELTRGERLVVSVTQEHTGAREVYSAGLRPALYPAAMSKEEGAAWLKWELSARLLDAAARLTAGDKKSALAGEAATYGLFFPENASIEALRIDAAGKDEALVVGWRYAFGNPGGYVVYRLPADGTRLRSEGSTSSSPVSDQEGAPTEREALLAWGRTHARLLPTVEDDTTSPLMRSVLKELQEETAAKKATDERTRREGAPGWARFRAFPSPGGLGVDTELRAKLEHSFRRTYAKVPAVVPLGDEHWLLGQKKSPQDGPAMHAGIDSDKGWGIALRGVSPAPAPQFDPTGTPWAGFLSAFELTADATVVPTQGTLGAKTFDWLQKLAPLCGEGHTAFGGPWEAVTREGNTSSMVHLDPEPLGFLGTTDGHRAHIVPLGIRPPHFSVPRTAMAGGGPVRVVDVETGLTPYFAWHDHVALSPTAWVGAIPKPLTWGTVTHATLKAWAAMPPPGKKGSVLASGAAVQKTPRTPMLHRGAVFGARDVRLTWALEVGGGAEENAETTLPGIAWDNEDDIALKDPFAVNPLFLQEMAELFLLSKANVRVAYTRALAPILFWQIEPVGYTGARLIQLHLLMPIRFT